MGILTVGEGYGVRGRRGTAQRRARSATKALSRGADERARPPPGGLQEDVGGSGARPGSASKFSLPWPTLPGSSSVLEPLLDSRPVSICLPWVLKFLLRVLGIRCADAIQRRGRNARFAPSFRASRGNQWSRWGWGFQALRRRRPTPRDEAGDRQPIACCPVRVRLRKFLESALRAFGIRCIDIREVEPEKCASARLFVEVEVVQI